MFYIYKNIHTHLTTYEIISEEHPSYGLCYNWIFLVFEVEVTKFNSGTLPAFNGTR